MGVEEELLETLVSLAERPYDFVMWAFPWNEPGSELEHRAGPVGWQKEELLAIQAEMVAGRLAAPEALSALAEAYQLAIRSGHDVGKTAWLAWLGWWALATRVDTRGRATSNTEKQLRTVLWPEFAKWGRLFLARDLFEVTATSIQSRDPQHKMTWRLDAIPWSEDNPEAFAGLHNYGKRIFVIFDEASSIADKIWETVDGVMHEAETELFWFCPGNPTRPSGRFYDCFYRFRSEWHCRKVDSRDVPFTNKEKIERAIALWGLDSDFVKVRYLGEFPVSASTQLIPVETILSARKRPAQIQHWEPLILACDIARFGTNETVALFRKGKDARTIPPTRWRGLSTVETGTRIASLIIQRQPDAVFIDEGGVGGGVVDFVRHLGHSVIPVNFGSSASSRPDGVLVANKRAEMYVLLLAALREGLAIDDIDELQDQLASVEYYHTKKQEIILIPKEEISADQDWSDAVAMTYAFPISQRSWRGARGRVKVDYDPLSASRLPSAQELYGSMH